MNIYYMLQYIILYAFSCSNELPNSHSQIPASCSVPHPSRHPLPPISTGQQCPNDGSTQRSALGGGIWFNPAPGEHLKNTCKCVQQLLGSCMSGCWQRTCRTMTPRTMTQRTRRKHHAMLICFELPDQVFFGERPLSQVHGWDQWAQQVMLCSEGLAIVVQL